MLPLMLGLLLFANVLVFASLMLFFGLIGGCIAELKPSVSSSTVTLPSWLGTCTGTLMVGQEWYSGFAALAAAILILLLGYRVSFDKDDADFAGENMDRMVKNAASPQNPPPPSFRRIRSDRSCLPESRARTHPPCCGRCSRRS